VHIRSITAFVDISYPLESDVIASAGRMLRTAREQFEEAGLTVQTTRLATQPFPAILDEQGPGKAADLAKDIEALAFVHELDFIALGPVRLTDPPAYVEAIPDILGSTQNTFVSVEIANREAGISLPRTRRVAEVIRKVVSLGEDGFRNLCLGATANVKPWTPFYPAAYHGGGKPRFAIATESADLALSAITSASSLEQARDTLIHLIEDHAQRIEEISRRVAGMSGMDFQGIDFSLAPFPEETRSIGAALERLGLSGFGSAGSLMAAAFLTDTLDRAQFTRTGFCGLMLPVLEDSVLALRAAEGGLGITELLTYSAVCGTGLDTVPLPGNIGEEVIAAILADMAALSLRLDKPLTARLMPLPDKEQGDATTFEFEYFANSRVIAPRNGTLSGLLAGNEDVPIKSRGPGKS
jgi:uncharacterized protein (UPF0210 family)